MTTLYTSNDSAVGFDVTGAGSLPADWAQMAGTWQAGTVNPQYGHAHSFGSTTQVDGDVAIVNGIATAGDMDVVFDQRINGNGSGGSHFQSVGVVVRCDSGYQNCYTVIASSSGQSSVNLLLFKRVSGSYSLLNQAAISGVPLTVGHTLRVRGQCLGTTIRAKAWDATAGTEPAAWTVSTTDSSVSAAGYAGLYYGLDAGSAVAMGVDDVVVSSLVSNYVTVDTPAAQPTGASFALTGTYGGTAPSAIDVSFDGGNTWSALTGYSASGNTWSGTATAPGSAGLTYALVRDHNNTADTNSSATFTVSAAEMITVATPGTETAGNSYTYSGTYTAGPPTALDYQFDSAGWSAASSPAISGGNWSFSATAPAAGTHALSVRDHNNTAVVGTSGSFATTSGASIAPNNAAFLYSPLNWSVTGGSAVTINAGAYFKILFTGTTCVLNFNATNMCTPASEIWWRIDDGPLTQANVASTVTLTIPAATLGNADVPYHLLEVMVKSTTETANRWNSVGSASGTAVIFAGLTLDAGASVLAPLAAAKAILCYGDSITEGVRTLGESAANDTDRNDAWMGWAYRLGALLGAEVAVVGFGATGLSVTGSGNVPVLGTSYSLLYAGQARPFTPPPDLIVINIGTNDGTTNTVAAMQGVLNGLISACPGKPIAVLRPFNGSQAANLQAAIAECSNPAVCHWIDTTGFFNTSYGADSLSLHPSGPNNLGLVAPQVAAALRPLLDPAGAATMTFRSGFQRGLLG